MKKNISNTFDNEKILIGMLHLAGRDYRERVGRAIEEISIYEEEGFDGVVVEDYHGSLKDVEGTLETLSHHSFNIQVGVNTLRNPYLAFEFADRYGASFVQFDTIQASAGDEYNPHRFNEEKYLSLRKQFPEICVLGGVRFKYIPPTGKSLEEDIRDGMSKCDAIVTTGNGTGIETPIEKLWDFKKIMGDDFPLIVGAGVNDSNIKEQMEIVNGAIIGSYVKNYDTENKIMSDRVKRLVDLVR